MQSHMTLFDLSSIKPEAIVDMGTFQGQNMGYSRRIRFCHTSLGLSGFELTLFSENLESLIFPGEVNPPVRIVEEPSEEVNF